MFDYSTAKEEILQIVNKLDVVNCTAFAATCCERMVPNYHAFCIVHGWGDPLPLDKALEFIWISLKTGVSQSNEVNLLLDGMGEITPDLDSFRSIYVWRALDAINAISDLLKYHLSQEKEYVVNVVDLAINTIYLYVQDVAFPMDSWAYPFHKTTELFEWASTSPIFINELVEQKRTLDTLLDCLTPSTDIFDNLRKAAQKSGINPIQRGLVVVRGH
jgi:hypothetical protein